MHILHDKTSVWCSVVSWLCKFYLLRVDDRLNKGSFCKDLKHPVILPRKSHVTELIILHFHQKHQHHLSNQGCDYITFKHNTHSASHIGGVGERQIRTVRNVLSSLTHDFGASLDNESLRTFLCETMAIVYCRPLTVDGLNDPLTAEPLTPNHPLTMKFKIILPPPGKFQRPYLYCQKRWQRVQYSTNEFWTCWKKKFLQMLQERRKWGGQQRNVSIGDVILIKEDNSP